MPSPGPCTRVSPARAPGRGRARRLPRAAGARRRADHRPDGAGEELDRVLGLELGADDYLVKPYGFRELVARIRAVTRRSERRGGVAGGPVRIGALELDRRTHEVHVDGTPVALTPKEFELLSLLATDAGAVRTRREILETVWDSHWYGPTKTLDVHVASLRRKLGDAVQIETVRGVGFRLRP